MGLFDSFKKKDSGVPEQNVSNLNICAVCFGQLSGYSKQLISGDKICRNCERKMRVAYYKGFDGYEDELDILTVLDIRQDIETDKKDIDDAVAMFPDCTAVGYLSELDEYGDVGETWITVLCCKGTFAVGDTITRIQGDNKYEHQVSAIVAPNGFSLEDSVNKGGFEIQQLNEGEWGWIKIVGEYLDNPDYSGKTYIVKS